MCSHCAATRPPTMPTLCNHRTASDSRTTSSTIRVKQNPELCIVAACYPETHPEARSAQDDLDHAKRKVDAGADVLITQLFFENARFFSFMDRIRAAGITVPVVPGIMPIVSRAGVKRMTSMCGCEIPSELNAQLEAVGDDEAATQELGVRWGTMQCRELLDSGAPVCTSTP